MNTVLHEWLIESFGGYELNSRTYKGGQAELVLKTFSKEYHLPVNSDTTSTDIVLAITHKELALAKIKLHNLPGKERMLKKEIRELTKQIKKLEANK